MSKLFILLINQYNLNSSIRNLDVENTHFSVNRQQNLETA